MNIITNNPFRILGLTGNVKEKELQKQIGIIKRYAEVGKTKSFDFDFEFIGDFTRNSDEIQQASNSIEQAPNKLIYSLFWFVKNSKSDEIAFNNLKGRDTEKAIEIWNKTLKEEITGKNYSSYLNLSTLYLALSTIDDQIELQKLQAGISLKGNLIHSENLKDFSKLVTGNGITNDPIEISKKFVDEVVELLKPYLNKRDGISTNELVSLFSTFPTSIQKYISSKFTKVPISNIDYNIEKTSMNRKHKPQGADIYGEYLYKSTKNDIALLKNLLGCNNIQFKMIANKIADEILQCSIDFFNIIRQEENKFDPGNDALRTAKYAKFLGITGHTKDRINETLLSIQEWVDDKPNRERHEAIAGDLAFVTNKLNSFQNVSISIENARDLINTCSNKLKIIKRLLGVTNELYVHLSSTIVQNAQEMIVQTVNGCQEGYQQAESANKLFAIALLKDVVEKACTATKMMSNLDMLPDLRVHYNKNLASLKSLANQLGILKYKMQ